MTNSTSAVQRLDGHNNSTVERTASLQFQIVVDAGSILLSPSPDGNMRAVITGLDAAQLRNIVCCIADAGPQALSLLRAFTDEAAK